MILDSVDLLPVRCRLAKPFRDGSVTVPSGPGLGGTVNREMLESITVSQSTVHRG